MEKLHFGPCDVWGSSKGTRGNTLRSGGRFSWECWEGPGAAGRGQAEGNVATGTPYLSQCLLLVLVWQQMASYWSASHTMRMM